MISFLRNILPSQIVTFISKSKARFGWLLISICLKSRVLSSFYYLVGGDFANEHIAVLHGRWAYHKSLTDIGESCALLRRNTHRIEKGLIMEPRRQVFAESYIAETVDCYKNAINSGTLSEHEIKWATDVLDEYFSTVGLTTTTQKAKSDFANVRKDVKSTTDFDGTGSARNIYFKPYSYHTLPESRISFDDLAILFVRRRSVRWYQDKCVSNKLVQKAANLASLAPSACNRQSYRFVFCNNREKVIEIAKCAPGTEGFAENLPAIIAVVGDLSAYPFERDRHIIYIDGSLAAMQMMLALETLGLASCCINWPDVNLNERRLKETIDLEEHEKVVMLLAVGYAKQQGGVPYSQKKTNGMIFQDIS